MFVFECCSTGSDTPQDFVKQGIRPRPRRTLFCGVSDPAEQVYAIKYTQICHCSAGPDTLQDLVLRGVIPRRVLFCGVLYPTGFCSVGIRPRWQIKTPQNQTKMYLELAILFEGTLFENHLHV
jgi:hypothetical protein